MSGPLGINNLRVWNFKSIEDSLDLEIRPITILAGPNSSGKSTIMQPVLLIKQTLDALRPTSFRYKTFRDRYGMVNADITDFEQIVPRFADALENEFSVSVKNHKVTVKIRFQKSEGHTAIKSISHKIYATKKRVLDTPLEIFLDDSTEASKLFDYAQEGYQVLLGKMVEDGTEFQLKRNRIFYEIESKGHADQKSFLYSFKPAASVEEDIQRIIHLPAIRGFPERTQVDESLTHPYYAGTFHDFTASIIEKWEKDRKNGDDDASKKFDMLLQQISNMNLAKGVSVDRYDDSTLSIRIGLQCDPQRLVSLADVGVGVSQALPILVSLQAFSPCITILRFFVMSFFDETVVGSE